MGQSKEPFPQPGSEKPPAWALKAQPTCVKGCGLSRNFYHCEGQSHS